jgi:hypothetical protein
MHRIRVLCLLVVCPAAALLVSCAGVPRYAADRGVQPLLAARPAAYPAARFAVLSDAHLYDASLGIEGSAFQDYMMHDRKLLPQSEEILDVALARVASLGVSFLLIPGDLTKDGEKQDHLLMARKLAVLREKGICAYVVPGNHDIMNPEAFSYSGSRRTRVENVTPAEFAEIYGDFGYREALHRDPDSLSYVAEPVPGLWLLAIDSANYSRNPGRSRPVTAGGFTTQRAQWVEGMLVEARRQGKATIALLHHGVVEHFAGEAKYSGQYLVNDWQKVSEMLAAYGVRVAFTGHFHAQDVAVRRMPGARFIFDVETGSLVSFPNPIRSVAISPDGVMSIRSSFITELPSFSARGENFWTFSRTSANVETIAAEIMKRLGVRQADVSVLAPQVADAFIAHYRGDESFTGTEMLTSKGIGLMAGIVAASERELVNGLWHDTEPADNDASIGLATGATGD